ncbi:unnamed protein product [Coregonus sp. 'balchen']|nr:unnamed protein product [Coregonus sp. 'balchen']
MASPFYSGQDSFYFNNFTKDFTETKHLSVKRGVDSCNLTISKTESGDSATYYCGGMEMGEVKFGEGTFLIVKGSESKSMSVLQLPVSESVQPGDSFRHGSGVSHPGSIYTHGDSVCNLPKRNLSLSDAGTYYCAVASCGEILFGNGTKLDIDQGGKEEHLMLVYCLGLYFIWITVLVSIMYKMSRR